MKFINRYLIPVLLSCPLVFSGSFQENEKAGAIRLYRELYQSSRLNNISWNGSVKNCNAGKLSQTELEKALNRINYFRKAVGVRTVTLSETYNEMAQEATLIMTANGQLSHMPTENWKCYSEKGARGAKNSNLGISDFTNFPLMAFVTGFLLDYGEPNNNCNHRKWLLNSRTLEMGYGNSGSYEAVFVTGVQQEPVKNPPEYIAYPPAGYFPYNLIFEKWTFGIPYGKKVDFRKARIEMFVEGGEKLSVSVLSRTDPWYFDPTIVWKAGSLFTNDEIKYVKNRLKEKGFVDKTIKVIISNIMIDGEKKDFEYKVIPIDPEK